jgi:penicillin-binding protein 2
VDHAAFVALAPSEDPQVVVATFIEHGLAGGQLAALVTRSVLEAWDALRRGVEPAPPEPPVGARAAGT